MSAEEHDFTMAEPLGEEGVKALPDAKYTDHILRSLPMILKEDGSNLIDDPRLAAAAKEQRAALIRLCCASPDVPLSSFLSSFLQRVADGVWRSLHLKARVLNGRAFVREFALEEHGWLADKFYVPSLQACGFDLRDGRLSTSSTAFVVFFIGVRSGNSRLMLPRVPLAGKAITGTGIRRSSTSTSMQGPPTQISRFLLVQVR
jgi:hypothetical protein